MSRKRPTIALCVIARDEERFIAGCLESAKPYVDEMLVVDTGSVDRTVEIAQALGARVEHFTWIDDFAAARNAAIQHVTTDWIIMLDADERLETESGPLLRPLAAQLPAGIHGYTVHIESRSLDDGPNRASASHVPRMFPRRADIGYLGSIHEDLRYLPDPTTTLLVESPIQVRHYGYDQEVRIAKNKGERNLRMLEHALESNPNDSRIQYFLALEKVTDKPREAITLIRKFAATATNVSDGFYREAFVAWARASIVANDPDELEQAVQSATAAGAFSAQIRQEAATYYEYLGQTDKAEQFLLLALDPTAPPSVTRAPGVGSWATRLQLARLYEAQGRIAQSVAQLGLAFNDAPEYMRARVTLMQAQLESRLFDFAAAASSLERAEQVIPDTLEAHTEMVHVRLSLAGVLGLLPDGPLTVLDRAVASADWQTAYDAVMRLDPSRPEALARLLLVAQRLHAADASEAALDLLGRALESNGPLVDVYRTLIPVFARLERYEEALEATEILRTLTSIDGAKLAA